MHKRRTSSRVLIIGKTDRRVELLKHHLADYFGKVDLLTDLEQLNSLTAYNFAVIVVTDTFGDVLKSDFFADIRSLHPRAGLLCLFDRISRQTEKDMRSAGLLFLGSYDHFEDCYGSVLERALRPQKTSKHRPYQPSNNPLKTSVTGKSAVEKKPGRHGAAQYRQCHDTHQRSNRSVEGGQGDGPRSIPGKMLSGPGGQRGKSRNLR
jgi:hypothetical protein